MTRPTQKDVQGGTERGCGEDLAKHLHGGNSEFGDFHGLQTLGSHDCKVFKY